MFYICVICDCVCVLKYTIYLIWPRQFSFGPDSSHLAHVFLIWLIPWPEQKKSQRGPCISTDASAVPISEININHENTQPALASHMAGVNQPAYDNDMSQGGEILENRTAAAALMQLHGHTRENLQSGDTDGITVSPV